MSVTLTQSEWTSRPSRLRDVASRCHGLSLSKNFKRLGIILSTSLKTATAETNNYSILRVYIETKNMQVFFLNKI